VYQIKLEKTENYVVNKEQALEAMFQEMKIAELSICTANCIKCQQTEAETAKNVKL
jgi:hypothetical protein